LAQEEALSVLESVALQRARAGSDRLLIFRLSSRWPDRYGPARLRAQEAGPTAAQIAAEMQWAAKQLEDFYPPSPEPAEVPETPPPRPGLRRLSTREVFEERWGCNANHHPQRRSE
jgi:hypothetical protein